MKINNKILLETTPQLVVFDLDNTLYLYEPAHKAALATVFKKVSADLDIAENDFRAYYDRARKDVKSNTRKVAASHSRLLYFKTAFELMGLGTLVLKSLELEQTYWRTFMANANLFDGVYNLLQELALQGIKTAIITDLTTQIQLRKLISFDLEHSFEYIITSEEAGEEKPNPAPFRLLIERTGKLDPIWMIGDDLEKDIGGAQQQLNAFGLLRDDQLAKSRHPNITPDAVFSSFGEILNLIRNINQKKYN
jgi:HAD superfamily hydrolase (TIGR01549 family)